MKACCDAIMKGIDFEKMETEQAWANSFGEPFSSKPPSATKCTATECDNYASKHGRCQGRFKKQKLESDSPAADITNLVTSVG